MNKSISTIDYDWLTQPTGDPFTDAGGLVIEYFSALEPYQNKDVLELIEAMTKIYVNRWGGKLNAFFLNSTITQPAFKGDKKISETLRFFKELIQERAEYQEGYCRITGRKTKLFYAGRDNHILSGSGTFLNFHHAFESGLQVSKEVLIRIFFAPFGLVQLSDKIALVQSNNLEVAKHFIVKNCQDNISGIGNNLTEGVLKSTFKNPANALFAFVDSCLQNLQVVSYQDNVEASDIRDVSLTLYHFTNFGASPEVQIHNIKAIVFAFYVTCQHPTLKPDWQLFVTHHYRNSKFKTPTYDATDDTWTSGKKVATYDEYKTWRNSVYHKLLNNQSILGELLRWSKKRVMNFLIIEYYQIYIRNMDKKTLDKIKELAKFIVNKDADKVTKALTRLNGCRSTHEVRRFLLNLIETNYQENNEKTLITIEEYNDYLFPDGTNWREIRDLILIAIYQKLHESQIQLDIEDLHNEEEEQSETINS